MNEAGGGRGGASAGGGPATHTSDGTSGGSVGSGGSSPWFNHGDCVDNGYWCTDGAVSAVTLFGVTAGQSCSSVVYQCKSGCRVDHLARTYPPAPQTLCNEWDAGAADAGTKGGSDAGVREGGYSDPDASTVDASNVHD
jgi:hypothetical protein